ncbi:MULTISPECIES: prenyltransferase/squalene oxidase repeat-containing protein [unclassified Micromonospora]|uniref:prenyltransferase/squalene oxidase repeat-containing protein n=1 Tax=unclassified Micromonospora TaxID=2617518 RepID=UPI0022B6D6A8|nr:MULTISPECIES: prenyltransferase/squalene oxidase repeat-containing protein [unclassified Micromonospora]MCZ7423585.1 peptidase [Verrucosispora sp. WMMA2121]WBB91282.1 peptidase [Verrucosispora sp. WMMC514]
MVVRLGRHRLLALLCGILAALTLTTPTIAAPTIAAPAHAGAVRTDAAAGWLARQLVDGERFEAVFDGVAYPDQGLTLDAVFAFAAAGVADDFGAQALAWVTRPDVRDGYIGDGTTEAYAGATAKLALAVAVRGADPTDVGGVDLIARLRSLQDPDGRFTDRSAWGDYSNAFSQSFAIFALDRTAQGVPAVAAGWLAGTRCPDGGYPLLPEQPVCVSDVDATAVAVQALRAAGRPADAAAGLRWLVSVQRADGGFTNSGGVANANSTGLAAQALRDGGRPLAWVRARVFLAGLQVGCAAPVTDRGAVDFDGGVFDPGTAPRATTQAVLGLAGTGYARLSTVAATTGAPTLRCR